MLVIFLLLSAFNLTSSSPLVTSIVGDHHHHPITLFGRALPDCLNAARQRTTGDIAWSCLATVFACTWVAIHPNLPGPGDSTWMRFKRRVAAMVYALIAPEFTITWALRQWFAAQRIVKEFNEVREEEVPWYLFIPNFLKTSWVDLRSTVKDCFKDPRKAPKSWTLTHGFFIQMGGFILYDGETPKRVLRFDDLKELIANGEVDAPKISEHEINDRSKGDSLSKLVVVLQTSWFILQCVARWVSHLPVTELEVVTLAFAGINILTYVLWWKKPEGILVAIPVQLKSESERLGGQLNSDTDRLLGDGEEKESWIALELKKELKRGCSGWVFFPQVLIKAALHQVQKVIGDVDFERKSLRVPTYHSETRPEEKTMMIYPIMIIGVLFGGLHLVPWSYPFPTHAERMLWRLSAIVITGAPVLFMLMDLLRRIGLRFPDNLLSQMLVGFIGTLITGPLTLAVPLYPIARLMLLAIAFTTLRALPPKVYLNIEWTNFIPHFRTTG